MPSTVSDEDFGTALWQLGGATSEQIEAAKTAQADSTARGKALSLAEALIQQGVITPAIRENVEKKAAARQAGGIQQLGPYKLLKKLGEGGMGAVYLAEDSAVGRKVALKVLAKQHAANAEFVARFRREAAVAAQLSHPNIVCVHNVGEAMGFHFIVMEYCEGEPLDKLLKREKTLPWAKSLDIVLQAAQALQHAHEHGIVHRDIKPANLILTPPRGTVRILDLGISKNVSEGEHAFLTQTGVAVGTPHYMSPEQARGAKNIDGRADIYSLGATLYHLLTGQTPFDGPTGAAIMLQHASAPLPNPKDLNPQLPEDVVNLVQRMMAKEPALRFWDCKELVETIQQVQRGEVPGARQATGQMKTEDGLRARPGVPARGGHLPHKGYGPIALQPHVSAPARGSLGAKLAVAALICIACGGALFYFMNARQEAVRREARLKEEQAKQAELTAALEEDVQRRIRDEDRRASQQPAKTEALAPQPRKEEAAALTKPDETAPKTSVPQLVKEEPVAPPPPVAPKPAGSRKVEPQGAKPVAPQKEPEPQGKAAKDANQQPPFVPVTQPPKPEKAVDDRTAENRGIICAVIKETSPLLRQGKFDDANAVLGRKLNDPAWAGPVDWLKQEQADIEALVKLRSTAIQEVQKLAGQQVTLTKAGLPFTGMVMADRAPSRMVRGDGMRAPRFRQVPGLRDSGLVVLATKEGLQATFSAQQLTPDDVEKYAPHNVERGEDFRLRAILYLAAGQTAKAKEFLSSPQTLNAEAYLWRTLPPGPDSSGQAAGNKDAGGDEEMKAAIGPLYEDYKGLYEDGVRQWQQVEPEIRAACMETVPSFGRGGGEIELNQKKYGQAVANFKNMWDTVLAKVWKKVETAKSDCLQAYRKKAAAKPDDAEANAQVLRLRKAMEDLFPKTPRTETKP